ncbi:hypothetical protein LCGC14_1680690 [marine sediment metagenome]|uniref:Uncharacterized protein n=1 Tax=marine sediment metagenome TaxID=412755 RepID=A0A0F9IB36_9ZZZZ
MLLVTVAADRDIAKEPMQGDALVRRYWTQTKKTNAIRVVIRGEPDASGM